ncbi:hypothetical protein ALC57_12222 [Trachymyrmex cornetzi]|uniref:Uncharacterized protein n=1 Tax=Trachymyrmex cornetzi TaxID=471704 RepID=A0A151J1L8_9HYME|nr:hypothetical protein ALC57_12222 [Trachymyrmex cornetzi]
MVFNNFLCRLLIRLFYFITARLLVLTRLLALTSTAYKFLEIGIDVGSMSYVEIAIGDTRDNRIVLLHTMWMAFIEKRTGIQRLGQSSTPSKVLILDLVIKFVEIRDIDNVKLSLCNKCMYMKPSTILFMLELDTMCRARIFRCVPIYK